MNGCASPTTQDEAAGFSGTSSAGPERAALALLPDGGALPRRPCLWKLLFVVHGLGSLRHLVSSAALGHVEGGIRRRDHALCGVSMLRIRPDANTQRDAAARKFRHFHARANTLSHLERS